jgi:hypothetical protein
MDDEIRNFSFYLSHKIYAIHTVNTHKHSPRRPPPKARLTPLPTTHTTTHPLVLTPPRSSWRSRTFRPIGSTSTPVSSSCTRNRPLTTRQSHRPWYCSVVRCSAVQCSAVCIPSYGQDFMLHTSLHYTPLLRAGSGATSTRWSTRPSWTRMRSTGCSWTHSSDRDAWTWYGLCVCVCVCVLSEKHIWTWYKPLRVCVCLYAC